MRAQEVRPQIAHTQSTVVGCIEGTGRRRCVQSDEVVAGRGPTFTSGRQQEKPTAILLSFEVQKVAREKTSLQTALVSAYATPHHYALNRTHIVVNYPLELGQLDRSVFTDATKEIFPPVGI